MRRLADFLFGSLAPFLEVLLVIAGLGVLGWEGVVYTLTGAWPKLTLAALWASQPASGLAGWLLDLPLSGTCFVAAAAMFFLMPPAYQHA